MAKPIEKYERKDFIIRDKKKITSEKAVIARYINDDGSVNDIDLIVLRQSLSEAINKLKNA